jgi:hypothetical protein
VSSETFPLFRTDTCGLRFDPARLRRKKTASARGLKEIIWN